MDLASDLSPQVSRGFFRARDFVAFFWSPACFAWAIFLGLESWLEAFQELKLEDFSWPYQGAYQGRIRAVSGPYQGRIRAVSGPYQGRMKAVSKPYQGRIRAVSEPYQGRIKAVSGPYQGRISLPSCCNWANPRATTWLPMVLGAK